jgi:hypothetical protein
VFRLKNDDRLKKFPIICSFINVKPEEHVMDQCQDSRKENSQFVRVCSENIHPGLTRKIEMQVARLQMKRVYPPAA